MIWLNISSQSSPLVLIKWHGDKLLKFYGLFVQQSSQDMNINSPLFFPPQMSRGVWYAEMSLPPTDSEEEEEDEEEGVCVFLSWLPSSDGFSAAERLKA